MPKKKPTTVVELAASPASVELAFAAPAFESPELESPAPALEFVPVFASELVPAFAFELELELAAFVAPRVAVVVLFASFPSVSAAFRTSFFV